MDTNGEEQSQTTTEIRGKHGQPYGEFFFSQEESLRKAEMARTEYITPKTCSVIGYSCPINVACPERSPDAAEDAQAKKKKLAKKLVSIQVG